MSASAPSGGGSRPLLDLLSPGYNDQVSPDAPSIFELMASDELKGLIQPAFRYVLAVSEGSDARDETSEF